MTARIVGLLFSNTLVTVYAVSLACWVMSQVVPFVYHAFHAVHQELGR